MTTKKKVIAVATLVVVCAIGVAKVLGYDVTPICEIAPSLCDNEQESE